MKLIVKLIPLLIFSRKLKEGGYYIIEDTISSTLGQNIMDQYWDLMLKTIGDYKYENRGNHFLVHKKKKNINMESNTNLTIVSGLWDIGRIGRGFEEHYLPRFKEFLEIPHFMILFFTRISSLINLEYTRSRKYSGNSL